MMFMILITTQEFPQCYRLCCATSLVLRSCVSPVNIYNSHSCVFSRVCKAIAKGIRPGNPENAEFIEFLISLWEFVRVCWAEDTTRRPPIHELTKAIRDAAVRRETLMPSSTPPDGESGLAPHQREKTRLIPVKSQGYPLPRGRRDFLTLLLLSWHNKYLTGGSSSSSPSRELSSEEYADSEEAAEPPELGGYGYVDLLFL